MGGRKQIPPIVSFTFNMDVIMKTLFVLVLLSVLPGCVTVGIDYRLNKDTRILATSNFRTIDLTLKGR